MNHDEARCSRGAVIGANYTVEDARREGRVRQSIPPTYDRRETGDRFLVLSRVNGRTIREQLITDPFIRTRITVSWRDLLKSLLRWKRLEIEVHVHGDPAITEDVMELDANYLGLQTSTRRQKFNERLNVSLEDFSYVCPE